MSKTNPKPEQPRQPKPRQLKRQKLERALESSQPQPESRPETPQYKPLG